MLVLIPSAEMNFWMALVHPWPANSTASFESRAFTARAMIWRASSRNAAVCSPVTDVVVWVLPYVGMTLLRINCSMLSSGLPLAV